MADTTSIQTGETESVEAAYGMTVPGMTHEKFVQHLADCMDVAPYSRREFEAAVNRLIDTKLEEFKVQLGIVS